MIIFGEGEPAELSLSSFIVIAPGVTSAIVVNPSKYEPGFRSSRRHDERGANLI